MTRSELTQYFETVRSTTEKLCEPLETEDHVVQPIMDVSPPKWHMGHTTWFFEAMLLEPFMHDYKPYHADFAYIFNSYYESLGSRVQRPLRGNLSRPSVEETVSYREAVNQRMGNLIQEVDEAEWPRFCGLVELGLNHEQQHQELLVTDI
jgi:hypothetical protein